MRERGREGGREGGSTRDKLKCIFAKCLHIQTSRRLNKAKQSNCFSKEKLAASGGLQTHDTLLSRPSALPIKLPRKLS